MYKISDADFEKFDKALRKILAASEEIDDVIMGVLHLEDLKTSKGELRDFFTNVGNWQVRLNKHIIDYGHLALEVKDLFEKYNDDFATGG